MSEHALSVLITGFTEAQDAARRQRARETLERLRTEIDQTEAILADESLWTVLSCHTFGTRVGPVRWCMTQLEAELNAQLEADGYRVTITVEQTEQS